MDQEQEHFLKHWVGGVFAGIEDLDNAAQERFFTACGQACGDSYTVRIFREAQAESSSLESFLTRLGEKFPEASYRLFDDGQIEVTYHACGCDLVRLGWVKTPLLCQCSLRNLAYNFSQALSREVRVECKQSILMGDDFCKFFVSII